MSASPPDIHVSLLSNEATSPANTNANVNNNNTVYPNETKTSEPEYGSLTGPPVYVSAPNNNNFNQPAQTYAVYQSAVPQSYVQLGQSIPELTGANAGGPAGPIVIRTQPVGYPTVNALSVRANTIRKQVQQKGGMVHLAASVDLVNRNGRCGLNGAHGKTKDNLVDVCFRGGNFFIILFHCPLLFHYI